MTEFVETTEKQEKITVAQIFEKRSSSFVSPSRVEADRTLQSYKRSIPTATYYHPKFQLVLSAAPGSFVYKLENLAVSKMEAYKTPNVCGRFLNELTTARKSPTNKQKTK